MDEFDDLSREELDELTEEAWKLPLPRQRQQRIEPQLLPRLMTIHEVARLMRKTVKAVRRMIDRNQLPVTRIGRRVFVRRDPLLKLLKIK